jgi:adenylate cyclase
LADERVQRRLMAILAVDVAGYSRLMSVDEAGTLADLKSLREELINPAIGQYGGRIVKLVGDGALVEFPSAVDAVSCAIAIQNGAIARSRAVPEDRSIRLRIGINVGDSIVDGDDIYGDGVNIAARLENLAPTDGICVSGAVHEHVRGKIAAKFVDLGEQEVKNIGHPVRVFQIVGDGLSPAAAAPQGRRLKDRPSIAVLPLTNMSGDSEQEYFADGMTEDLITELSRFQGITVIARNSTFAYKGKSVRVQDVRRELGVHYVVEGSVRKLGGRVRITIQLIDALSGGHLWAERYDRDMADIFDLQDELTRAIVATISGRLESAVAEGIRRKPPSDLGAYDCVMRAKLCHHRGGSEDNAEAMQLLDKAIALDPELASAYAWKVCVISQAWTRGYRPFSEQEFAMAVELIKKGYSADENDLECLRILCEYHLERREFDEARRYHEKAYRLNPNDPRIVAQRGELSIWSGDPLEGLDWVEHAIHLDPFGADDWAHILGYALFGARRYADALDAFRRVSRPRYIHYAYMAASAAHASLPDIAGNLAAEVLKLNGQFAAKDFVESLFYREEDDNRHLLDGLRKAGLPD